MNVKPNEPITCQECKKTAAAKDTSLHHPNIRAFLRQKKLYKPSRYKEKSWCNACIERLSIQIADWEKQQTWGYLCWEWSPILYYQDQTRNCKACKETFLFSADEQKYWYEELRIFTDVAPKMCAPCRKKSRHVKGINQELEPLLKACKINPAKQDLVRIAELYEQLGNRSKAGQYRKLAMNI